MSEVVFSQKGKGKTLEECAKMVYSGICGWTLVHGGLSDPVGIQRKRQAQRIEMEKKMFIAQNFLKENQAKELERMKNRNLQMHELKSRGVKIDEEMNKEFENEDNWGGEEEDTEHNEQEETNPFLQKIPLSAEAETISKNIIQDSKQKRWTKYIEMAQQRNKGQTDLMLASYFATTIGIPLTYPDEMQPDGTWEVNCKLTDILVGTGYARKKKDAKNEAATELVKLILLRHENEETRFVF